MVHHVRVSEKHETEFEPETSKDKISKDKLDGKPGEARRRVKRAKKALDSSISDF